MLENWNYKSNLKSLYQIDYQRKRFLKNIKIFCVHSCDIVYITRPAQNDYSAES